MQAREFLLEAGALDAALKRGWVRIKYVRLDGMSRIMMATTKPSFFSYTYKRPGRPKPKNIIRVWEHGRGWRSLRRNRVLGWVEAGPVDAIDPSRRAL